MSLEYTGIPYFPLTSNFFEEDVPELLEAKFGIKASYLLIRLLSKITSNTKEKRNNNSAFPTER